MFTIKATYRSETRKFVLSSGEFPTYQALQDQLCKVFPISHSVYLSKVIFSPTGDSSGRILLMLEVRSEREYEEHAKPYRGKQWPNAVLRFSVFDEVPHKQPQLMPWTSSVSGGLTSSSDIMRSPVIPGPYTPEPSYRLRSLLDHCNQRSQELAHRHRTLPPLPEPRHYHYSQASPWRWLPPPAPVPPPPSPPFPEVRVQAPTPGPIPPPPPPPVPNRLRPVASSPALSPSIPAVSSTPSIFPSLGFPPPPPLPPPPPPPQPSVLSPRLPGCGSRRWSAGFGHDSCDFSMKPPPLPEKPLERSWSEDSLYQDMPWRRSPPPPPPLRKRAEHHPEPLFPAATNRHSWTVGGPSTSSPLFGHPRRRSDVTKRLRGHGNFLADERRRMSSVLSGEWNFGKRSLLDSDDSSDGEKENVAEVKPKLDKGKGKATAVEIETVTDSEDSPSVLPPFKPYAPLYTSAIPEDTVPLSDLLLKKHTVPTAGGKDNGDLHCCDALKWPELESARFPVNARSSNPGSSYAPAYLSATAVDNARRKVDERSERGREDALCEGALRDINDMQSRVNSFMANMRLFVDNVLDEGAHHEPTPDVASTATTTQDPAPAADATPIQAEDPVPEAPKPIHCGVRCDTCNKTIEGVRHKCLDCPDYDLCTPCLTQSRVAQTIPVEPNQARLISGHQDNHIFFAIEEPGDLWLAATFESAENGASSAPTLAPRAADSTSAQQPILPEPSVPRAPRHHATCDLCDSSIIDKRYKCLQCPDWDVCEQCFSIVDEQHPGHGFVLITDPAALHQYHIVRSVPRPYHHARCDECNEGIMGVRYKCMHPSCLDYDLCAKCEALPIPVHPPSHPMLKVRSPDTLIPKVKRYDEPEPAAAPAPIPTPAEHATEIETTFPVPIAVPLGPPSSSAVASLRVPTPYTIASTYESSRAVSPPLLPRMPTPPSIPPISAASDYGLSSPRPVALPSMPGALLPLTPPPLETRTNYTSINEFRRGSFEDIPFDISRRFGYSYPLIPTMNASTSVQEDASPATSRSESPQQLPPPPTMFYPPPESAFAPSTVASPHSQPRSLEQDRAPLIDLTENGSDRLIDLTQSSSDSQSQPSPVDQPQENPFDLAESVQTERELAPTLLPQVPQTDLHELFDLAAQFRHLWAQSSADGSSRKGSSPANAATEEVVSNISPPTELASSHSGTGEEQEPAAAPAPEEPVQPPPVAASPISAVELLSTPRRPLVQSSVISTLSEMLRALPPPSSSSATETSSSRPVSFITDDTSTVVGLAQADLLRATFIADNNIPDGQIFPPGAEFVKSWAMRNDGTIPWPETTELVFVAGHRLQIDGASGERFKVGTVYPGEMVDVWTGEMKAPDIPGKYISYWRLSDGQGNRFGHSIWVEITVVEPAGSNNGDGGSSLSSSSIIMPKPPSATSQSQPAPPDEATTAEDDAASSSLSFIDVPSDDDDSDLFEDSRSQVGSGTSPVAPTTQSPDVEYVVLYDSSDDGEL